MNTVAIVDYGACNLDSVVRAVEECGGAPLVTDRPTDLDLANHIILPGVGAFGEAMRNIKDRGLDVALKEQVIGKQIPFLGICLGMQLLASTSDEFGEFEGLGWIPGEARRLEPTEVDTRVPHIGWNEVVFATVCPLFGGIPDRSDFYFAHSYAICPRDMAHVAAVTPYGDGFVSVVQRDHILGVQFHPEKSQRLGFQVLRNFLAV